MQSQLPPNYHNFSTQNEIKALALDMDALLGFPTLVSEVTLRSFRFIELFKALFEDCADKGIKLVLLSGNDPQDEDATLVDNEASPTLTAKLLVHLLHGLYEIKIDHIMENNSRIDLRYDDREIKEVRRTFSEGAGAATPDLNTHLRQFVQSERGYEYANIVFLGTALNAKAVNKPDIAGIVTASGPTRTYDAAYLVRLTRMLGIYELADGKYTTAVDRLLQPDEYDDDDNDDDTYYGLPTQYVGLEGIAQEVHKAFTQVNDNFMAGWKQEAAHQPGLSAALRSGDVAELQGSGAAPPSVRSAAVDSDSDSGAPQSSSHAVTPPVVAAESQWSRRGRGGSTHFGDIRDISAAQAQGARSAQRRGQVRSERQDDFTVVDMPPQRSRRRQSPGRSGPAMFSGVYNHYRSLNASVNAVFFLLTLANFFYAAARPGIRMGQDYVEDLLHDDSNTTVSTTDVLPLEAEYAREGVEAVAREFILLLALLIVKKCVPSHDKNVYRAEATPVREIDDRTALLGPGRR